MKNDWVSDPNYRHCNANYTQPKAQNEHSGLCAIKLAYM